jgi:hypothetical protein
MFGISDLIVVSVIKDGLDFLSKNPYHLQFILGAFCSDPIRNQVGDSHIKECIDFVTQNRIQVAPYYQLDMKRRPCIGVVASGAEAMQFLGDAAYDSSCGDPCAILPPRVYCSFDAVGIKGIRRDVLLVPQELKLETKLWPGLHITNGPFSANLIGTKTNKSGNTELYLDTELPTGIALRGWSAQSDVRSRGVKVSASTDDVRVQMTLTTTGDLGVHRLLSIVLRYCLKRGRPFFDKNGLQVATYTYTPPIMSEQSEIEFESTCTIDGKFTDHWIESEFDVPDSAGDIQVNMIAHPISPPAGREDVDLD